VFAVLASCLGSVCSAETAINYANRAMELNPSDGKANLTKAVSLQMLGEYEAAGSIYSALLRANPTDPQMHLNLSVVLLCLQRSAEGWEHYKWRKKSNKLSWEQQNLQNFVSAPLWAGENLDGKTILLVEEQGLGDVIQCLQYAGELKKRYNCKIQMTVREALLPLIEQYPHVDQWITEISHSMPDSDYHAYLFDLPGVLDVQLDEFSNREPYIHADPGLVDVWREKLADYGGLKVAIVWQGNKNHSSDHWRSFPLKAIQPLSQLQGVTFFSLQRDHGVEQLAHNSTGVSLVNLGEDIDRDTGIFVETAAVLKNMDLLITCDSSVNHLASALGVKSWLALAAASPDWRWGSDRDDYPSYPEMRIYRCPRTRDWQGVFESMAQNLAQSFPEVSIKSPSLQRLHSSPSADIRMTKYGALICPIADKQCTPQLNNYGEFMSSEIDLISQFLLPGGLIIEIGANIGEHTIPLSNLVGDGGDVLAFENRPTIHQTLCANVLINGLSNVECVESNLFEVAVNKLRTHHIEGLDPTTLIKIAYTDDNCAILIANQDFIKSKLPAIYIRGGADENSCPLTLTELLRELGYQIYVHNAATYQKRNFYGASATLPTEPHLSNLLCIPSTAPIEITGLARLE
jgi:hypothetical protein